MKIVCDSREQKGYRFEGYEGVEVIRGTLPQGDYSLVGLENHCSIERKSLSDLTVCLGRDRERFFREMYRARGMEFFAVVVESTFLALANGEYLSRISPKSAVATVCAIMARMNIPFIFAGSRDAAEGLTHVLLRQYLRGALHKAKVLQAAMNEA